MTRDLGQSFMWKPERNEVIEQDAEPPDAGNDGGEPDSGEQPDSGKNQDQDGGKKDDKQNDDKDKDKNKDKQKDAGQVERRDLRKIALDEPGDDTGPLGRANEEIGRELLIDQRQARAESLGRDWPLEQTCKDRKTAQESGIGRLGARQEPRGAGRRALVFGIRSAGAPSRCDGLNDSHWSVYRKGLGGNPPGLSRGPSEQGIDGEVFHRPRPSLHYKSRCLTK